MTATPTVIARQAAERRHLAERRYLAARRRDAAQRGYRGPLTRDEATMITLADLNAAGHRQDTRSFCAGQAAGDE